MSDPAPTADPPKPARPTEVGPGRPGEFELIRRYFAPLANEFPGAFKLRDDAAVIAPSGGHELVMTADALIDGVHFLPDDPPDLVARKALRVNLSDLAAKGARPRAYLLIVCFPSAVTEPWIASFARGLTKDQREFAIHLAGGDTCVTPGPLTIAITAIGEVTEGTMLKRSGAKAGHELWVTGTLGDGALGLAVRRNALAGAGPKDRRFLTERYRLPQPRVALGHRLVGAASAAMDVSDGLVQDLGHLCAASKVGAIVEAASLPLSPPVRRALEREPARLADVLGGGDDYEILFTAPPALAPTIADFGAAAGVAVTRIGRIVAGTEVTVTDPQGQPIPVARRGFTHL
jgi:thiamine-monophosphate kinase